MIDLPTLTGVASPAGFGREKREKARAEFEALDLQLRELHRKEGELLLAARAYWFEIYRCEGWMNFLVGKRDTWEEALASIEPRRAQAGGEAARRAS